MISLDRDIVVYGVDFGMSTSSLAIMRRDRTTGRWDPSPRLVTDRAATDGPAYAIPTAVCLKDDGKRLAVGGEAVNLRKSRPAAAYRDNFKRYVKYRPTRLSLDGTFFPLVEVIAEVLRLLYERARETGLGEPTVTMITHPVGWHGEQRRLLRDAAVLAGFPADTVYHVEEPKAAWEFACSDGSVARSEKALVFDLGGGTFDCAVVHPSSTGLPPIIAAGSRDELGGHDFDSALFNELKRRLPQIEAVEHGSGGVQLMSTCESIKKRLSDEPVVQERLVELPTLPLVQVSRADFEQLIGEKVEETLSCCAETLREAETTWTGLSAVIPVGGSTLIPLVNTVLERQAPGRVVSLAHRDTAVVRGAALLAARKVDDMIAERAPDAPTMTSAPLWTPKMEGAVAADSVGPPLRFGSRALVRLWSATSVACAATGFLVWLYRPDRVQAALALAAVVVIGCAVAYSIEPVKRSRTALNMRRISNILSVTEFAVALIHLYRAQIEHHSGDAALGWAAAGTGLAWSVAASSQSSARRRGNAVTASRESREADQAVLKQVGSSRWFGNTSAGPPAFLEPLFEIAALRGFELPASTTEPDVRYVLVAGDNVVLVGRLASPDQRPRLGAAEESWAATLKVPLKSVRTILVAPGFAPPPVAAHEYFDMRLIITTEPGLKDIIGPWLELDSRIRIPPLKALLATVDQGTPGGRK